MRHTLTQASIGRSKQPFNINPFNGIWSPCDLFRGTLLQDSKITVSLSYPPPTPATHTTHMLSSKLSTNNPIILDPC